MKNVRERKGREERKRIESPRPDFPSRALLGPALVTCPHVHTAASRLAPEMTHAGSGAASSPVMPPTVTSRPSLLRPVGFPGMQDLHCLNQQSPKQAKLVIRSHQKFRVLWKTPLPQH